MLIDDDIDELDVFTHALHSIDKSIKCTQVENVADAVKFLTVHSPECIFIDFNMPRTNGLECLLELKKLGATTSSRIILYSNYIDEEICRKAMASGAHYCLRKPAMINLLSKRLKDILEN